MMSVKRIVGLVLIVVGIVALVWGGVFWTDSDTLVDAGPLEITTQERDGVALPPVLGIIALIGGIVLMVVPDRRRA
jgi:drug/metabolite transporter (DMT)-like permease